MSINIDRLREIALLSAFSDEELECLVEYFHQEEFAPPAIVFRQHEAGNSFAFVLQGALEILQDEGTANECLLSTILPGDFVGEMSLLDPGSLRVATGRVRDALVWVKITQRDYHALLASRPALALRLVQEMIRRLRRSESATIRELKEKNRALAQAYADLQRAQSALIENEKLEHELEIARTVQKNILPRQIIEVPGWQITAHWQPARSVSGDFFDIFPYLNGRVGLLIADVSGKGMPAALVMATTCSMVRAVATSEISPGALLGQVNQLLCAQILDHTFITCFYGILDPASGQLHFANAGHSLPIKIGPGGSQELRATGMPLGLLPEMIYEEKETRLEPGEGVLLYTDGLVEAHNQQREMFGLPRLHQYLSSAACGPQTIDSLLASLADFTGPDWEQEDDVTLVVFNRSGA